LNVLIDRVGFSPNATPESPRQDAIRKKQATPFQIYDPWGKPGAGAPTSNADGNIRTHRNVVCIQTMYLVIASYIH